jgi:hypothetical protein
MDEGRTFFEVCETFFFTCEALKEQPVSLVLNTHDLHYWITARKTA